MKEVNRDLLLLSKNNRLSQDELDREVEQLHTLLYRSESWENFCIAHEVIDINRHKVIQKPYLLQKVVNSRSNNAFVFINNKN